MTNNKATDIFITRKFEIDALLEQLAAASADHFNTDPEKLNWADVGSLVFIQEKLSEIAEFVNSKK